MRRCWYRREPWARNVIGEIELAAQFFPGRIVAITGSNGKTTTTTLAGEIVDAGGYPTVVGGNIGTPAISLVEGATAETIAVLEVSSFQLETIQTFRPRIAVVLNVTPDHLDRHRTFAAYTDAKARIFENQGPEDFAVLNADDPTCVEMAARTQAQVFWFSRKREVKQGAFVHDGRVFFRDAQGPARDHADFRDSAEGRAQRGKRSGRGLRWRLLGCEPDRIRKAVHDFKAVEHRLEHVATIRGVEYYNDSKATNVDATIKALESFPANIHLILGGKDKGSDYTVLNDLLRQRVKRVYTIGAAAAKIESQIKGAAEIVHAETLETPSGALPRLPSQGISCCWLPPAPASTSFATTSTAARYSRKWFEALSAR